MPHAGNAQDFCSCSKKFCMRGCRGLLLLARPKNHPPVRKEFAKACRVAHPPVAQQSRFGLHQEASKLPGRHTASTPLRTFRIFAFAAAPDGAYVSMKAGDCTALQTCSCPNLCTGKYGSLIAAWRQCLDEHGNGKPGTRLHLDAGKHSCDANS